jgi:hypothetical protein
MGGVGSEYVEVGKEFVKVGHKYGETVIPYLKCGDIEFEIFRQECAVCVVVKEDNTPTGIETWGGEPVEEQEQESAVHTKVTQFIFNSPSVAREFYYAVVDGKAWHKAGLC